MATPYITIGCPTTGGGTVLTGNNTFLVAGIPIACVGDTASCVLHTTIATIMTGDPYMQVMGKPVARVNDSLSCGCKLLPQQSLVVGDTGPSAGGTALIGAANLRNTESIFKDSNKNQEIICTCVKPAGNLFSPFGIANASDEGSADKLNIELKVKKGNFDRITVEAVGGSGSQIIADQQGSYSAGSEIKVTWDGFINDKYDSTEFISKGGIKLNIKGYSSGNEESSDVHELNLKYANVKWIDTKVDRAIKTLNYKIRVAFIDGGTQGLNRVSNVPQSALISYSKQPITTSPIAFDDMKKLALHGVEKYWSRNSTNTSGVNILINGQPYEVFVQTEDSSGDALPPIKLIYVTNSKVGRSRNWELSRITFFNDGYIKYSDGWFFVKPIVSERSFAETFAHEIGHELLKEGGGHLYSKTHKGTSSIFQSPIKGKKYPITGEIDLMKYTDQLYKPSDFYSRVVASEGDVSSLIWIGGVK